MHKILLFDIDGTLLQIKQHVIRGLIGELVQQYTPDVSLDELAEIPFAGRTDRAIFEDLLNIGRQPVSLFDELKQHYIDALQSKLTAYDILLYEPVFRVLEYCTSQNIPMGLLTGNFREIAVLKTRLAGIGEYFKFGAFGCDHPRRHALPEIARQSASEYLGVPIQSQQLILIGDTPNDIKAARYGNSRAVAVSTGSYSYKQLSQHKPDLLLNDMSRPEKWIQQLLDWN